MIHPMVSEAPNPEGFPIYGIPDNLRRAIINAAHQSNTSITPVAISALSAMSLVCQGLIKVQRLEKLISPVSLFMLSIQPSGERKSAVNSSIFKGVYRFIGETTERLAEEKSRHAARYSVWSATKRGLMNALRRKIESGDAGSDIAEQLEAHEDKREPMDRHLAAFILSRNRRTNDRLFHLLAPTADAGQRAVAILNILADVQKKFHPEDMPAITLWVAGLLVPSLERFHNRPLREKALKDLKRLSRKGRLEELVQLVDDSNPMRRDSEAFEAASKEYQLWEIRSRELSSNNSAKAKSLLTQGRQVTAFLSAMAAIVTLLVAIFLEVS